jgi:hypothetical protein
MRQLIHDQFVCNITFFLYTSLHDPTQLGGPESSGAGFFTFGMGFGIKQGFLTGAAGNTGEWMSLSDIRVFEAGDAQ